MVQGSATREKMHHLTNCFIEFAHVPRTNKELSMFREIHVLIMLHTNAIINLENKL